MLLHGGRLETKAEARFKGQISRMRKPTGEHRTPLKGCVLTTLLRTTASGINAEKQCKTKTLPKP